MKRGHFWCVVALTCFWWRDSSCGTEYDNNLTESYKQDRIPNLISYIGDRSPNCSTTSPWTKRDPVIDDELYNNDNNVIRSRTPSNGTKITCEMYTCTPQIGPCDKWIMLFILFCTETLTLWGIICVLLILYQKVGCMWSDIMRHGVQFRRG